MICANCGFHNGPDDEFCGSCGQYLWTEGSEQATAGKTGSGTGGVGVTRGPSADGDSAPIFDSNITDGSGTGFGLLRDEGEPAGDHGPADPDAMTRTVPANLQRCWNCGTANEATRTFCQSCGQQLKQARTRRWRAVGGGRGASAQDEGAAAGPAADRTRRLALIGGGVAVAAVLLIGAAVMGGFLGGKDDVAPGGSARATAAAVTTNTGGVEASAPAASAGPTDGGSGDPSTAPIEPTSSATTGGRFRCETQTLAAPAPGRWEVRTVRYGDRAGFDYLTFNLRRRGSAEETGGVTAELVPLEEVESRFGFDGPDEGDLALVVRFEGPIGLNASFGRDVGQRALREFRLLREGGVTYAALGVAGDGCFELRSPDWTGGSGANAAVTIDVER